MKNDKKILMSATIFASAMLTTTIGVSAATPANGMSDLNDLGSGSEVRSALIDMNTSPNASNTLYASKISDMKCGEGKCGEGKCGEEKKSEDVKKKTAKKADAKKGEVKADAKKAATKKADAKKSESKSTESKCGEGKCG